MVSLKQRAQKKKKTVLLLSALMLTFFCLEVYWVFNEAQSFLPLVVVGSGLLGLVWLQWSYLNERRFLVETVIKNLVDKKTQDVDKLVLNKLLKKDFSAYLRRAHIFIPRDVENRNELERVEGLSAFVEKYKTYAELNLLKDFSEEILDKNKKIKLSFKELSVDAALFVVPFALVSLPLIKGAGLMTVILSVLRLMTTAYYFMQYRESLNESFSLTKIEHFLFGDFDVQQASATRITLDKLRESESSSIFFLIDAPRKSEIEKIVRHQTSGRRDFKDWSVISAENSVYKNKVKSNKAFILFPNDMLFPFEEMQSFIEAFDEVIVVDSSPAYARPESAVFYLDQDQKIKKVHMEKNVNRLSGDKGLILRNLRKNNLDLFLTQVEQRILSNKPTYLVYEDVHEKISCEQNFVYPSGSKMVSISSALKHKDPDFYCNLSDGTHREKMERAKTFLANCSYHKIYSSAVIKEKLKRSFRAS